jgi:cell division protein FtsI (penicillin-binding protein 3)
MRLSFLLALILNSSILSFAQHDSPKIDGIIDSAMLFKFREHNATSGLCVVVDVTSGKIKAISGYNRNINGKYDRDLTVANANIEPASCFKLISLWALLEDGYVTLTDSVDLGNGSAIIDGKTIQDVHKRTGKISIADAFANSSDVAFAKLFNIFYVNKASQFFDKLKNKFLITEPINLGVGVSKNLSKNSQNLSPKALPWIANGYEVKTTPLHLLMWYSTTNDYVSGFMNSTNTNSLTFYVMYSKTQEPPAYIEALMLYRYYNKNNRLPMLNNSF